MLQMVWIETPTNPTMKVTDIRATVDMVKQHGDIIVVVDNTFMSAYFQVCTRKLPDIIITLFGVAHATEISVFFCISVHSCLARTLLFTPPPST